MIILASQPKIYFIFFRYFNFTISILQFQFYNFNFVFCQYFNCPLFIFPSRFADRFVNGHAVRFDFEKTKRSRNTLRIYPEINPKK